MTLPPSPPLPPPFPSSSPPPQAGANPSEAGAKPALPASTVVDPSRGWAFHISRAGLIGIGVSLILHSLILTVFAVVTIATGGGGGRSALGAPVEVAIADSSEVVSLNQGELTSDTPGVDEIKGSVDLPPTPVVEAPGGSGLSDAGDPGGNMGTGLGGAGTGTGIGVGPGSGGSGAGGTSFFGVEARGQRFAFVCDTSGSMDGEKLDFLKRELIKAIDRLGDNSSFVIVCFDSDAHPLNNSSKLLPASGKNKKSAIEAINALHAGGGTEPLPALSMALRNRPRPDAIYFMTDGLFDAGVVDQLRAELRGGRNVPIHCISFVDRSSEALMRKIAQMSDGSYTHVDSANGAPPPPPGRRRP